MQRQVLELLVRRQKPNLWLPLRSVKTKVKCCTATPSFALCGQMQSELERRTQTKQTNKQTKKDRQFRLTFVFHTGSKTGVMFERTPRVRGYSCVKFTRK